MDAVSTALIRVDANAAAIRDARKAASTKAALRERRETVTDALLRLKNGEPPAAVLETLALGMYLTGHTDRAAAGREQLAHARLAGDTLATVLRMAERRGGAR